MENTYSTDELQHWGVKGMKWGVRRTPKELGHNNVDFTDRNSASCRAHQAKMMQKANSLVREQFKGPELEKAIDREYRFNKAYDKYYWGDPGDKNFGQVKKEYESFYDDPGIKKIDKYTKDFIKDNASSNLKQALDGYEEDYMLTTHIANKDHENGNRALTNEYELLRFAYEEAYTELVVPPALERYRNDPDYVEHSDSIDELQHWGIKGMKWGQRRYQNKDGSLTPAGQKRYNKEMEKLKKDQAKLKEAQRIQKNKQRTQSKLDKLEAAKKKLKEDQKALADEKKGKKKPEDIEETPEQRKERLLKSTNAKELYKHKDELSYQEIDERIKRIDLEAKLHGKIVEEHKQTGREKFNEWAKDTSETIESATNLYKKVDNAYSTVASSAIGKTLAKKLGLEPPKKDWDWNEFWANRNKKSDKEMQDAAARAMNETKIRNNMKNNTDNNSGNKPDSKAADTKDSKDNNDQTETYSGTVEGKGNSRSGMKDGGQGNAKSSKSNKDDIIDSDGDWVDDPVSSVPTITTNTGKNFVAGYLGTSKDDDDD